jgi:hypothetical protein
MTNTSSQEAEPNQTAITTGGGAYTAGNVTAGGDFVGCDQITIHVNTMNRQGCGPCIIAR